MLHIAIHISLPSSMNIELIYLQFGALTYILSCYFINQNILWGAKLASETPHVALLISIS